MGPFPLQAYLDAYRQRDQNKQKMFEQLAQAVGTVGQTGSDLIQKRAEHQKQLQKQKQWSDAIDQMVKENPSLSPYSGALKTDKGTFEKIVPAFIKQKQAQQMEAVPFEQAAKIAETAGNANAAAPFIQTAQAQGRDYLTKQEMSDLFKTITTGASAGRGKYFEGMLDVNRGRLELQKRIAAFGGQYGKNQLALNTALGHVQTAGDAYNKIENTNEQFLNVPINKLRKMTNDPNIEALGISLNALQGELANVFKGTGATDAEISHWQNYLNENLTPQQYIAAVGQIEELLDSRLAALSYEQKAVSPDVVDPTKTLTPKSKAIMKNLDEKKKSENSNKILGMKRVNGKTYVRKADGWYEQ